MSLHIAGNIVTHHAPAANNRGENEGNLTTLQKLLWKGSVHTTVSSEAIRWAIRYDWQQRGLKVRRRWDDDEENYVEANNFDAEAFIDDDLMGYMLAAGAKLEGNAAENQKGKGKGTVDKRRGVLEVCRAVSLEPFAGDVTFNAKAGEKGSTSLYGTEVHATRYQYGFSITPDRLKDRTRAKEAIEAIVGLGEVAGNHSRYLYDFAPESVVFRVSHDPSPRVLYCFEDVGDAKVGASSLVRAVKCGDIDPKELFVGGILADEKDGEELEKLGVQVFKGVKQARDAVLKAIEAAQ